MISYFKQFELIIIGTILFTIGELLYTPSSQAVYVNLIDKNNKGPYSALISLVQSGSKIFSAIFLSLSSLLSQQANSILILIIGLLSIFLLYISYTSKSKIIGRSDIQV